MNRQYTGWGYIDWLKPMGDERMISLNVGIVSIKPRAHMNAHIHFTDVDLQNNCPKKRAGISRVEVGKPLISWDLWRVERPRRS